jgi:aldehyde dehydrogenase (NAD+)
MVNETPYAGAMLIDGELRAAGDGQTYASLNPFSEQPTGLLPEATQSDTDRAIAAARRAFDETDWPYDARKRTGCLTQLLEAIIGRRDEFVDLIVADVGNPVSSAATGQVDIPIEVLTTMRDFAAGYEFERVLEPNKFIANDRLVRREPYGVVAALTPYNVPLADFVVKLGPALAAGNTAVLKPSPLASVCAARLAELIAAETDFPPGTVNIVTSSRAGVGEQLVADARVDMVAFTGSAEVGQKVLAGSAPHVRRVLLELGGKSAQVVLDEQTLSAALSWGAIQLFHMAGQGCTKVTRFLVPRHLLDDAAKLLVENALAIPWGDPADSSTVLGPLISAGQRERVLGAIQRAADSGITPVTGGGPIADAPSGYFVEPTVYVDPPRRSELAQRELFGPVGLLMPYADERDALALANDTPYGLSGAVWGADQARALSLARRMRTGTVSVNQAQWHSYDTPFGGFKHSGLGRTKSVLGFEEFTQIKVIGI